MQTRMGPLVPVHPWPQQAAAALRALQSGAACAVISVATPPTEDRTQARVSIRAALRDLLAAYWVQPPASIQFCHRRGEAPALLPPAYAPGLSISHAPGCSVAVVHLRCTVGIDVVGVDADGVGGDSGPLGWDRVAHDYLGPVAHQRLAQVAPAERALAFAHAWSQWEAGLKCLGQGLTEWTPALGQALGRCTVVALDLPAAWCGALAVGPPSCGPGGSQQGYKPSISFRF